MLEVNNFCCCWKYVPVYDVVQKLIWHKLFQGYLAEDVYCGLIVKSTCDLLLLETVIIFIFFFKFLLKNT